MSSIATFYILPEVKRGEFTEAHRNQKTSIFKRTLFGRKEVVTGDRFIWEYLDAANCSRTDFPFSGFAVIDYLFTFVEGKLPKDLKSALAGAAVDDHCYVIPAQMAASFAEYLRSHLPESAALAAFFAEHYPSRDVEHLRLRETHDFLLLWFGGITTGNFGVLHITF